MDMEKIVVKRVIVSNSVRLLISLLIYFNYIFEKERIAFFEKNLMAF